MREVQEVIANMTNEEYREELNKILDCIENNQKLRFIYRYIKSLEKE